MSVNLKTILHVMIPVHNRILATCSVAPQNPSWSWQRTNEGWQKSLLTCRDETSLSLKHQPQLPAEYG